MFLSAHRQPDFARGQAAAPGLAKERKCPVAHEQTFSNYDLLGTSVDKCYVRAAAYVRAATYMRPSKQVVAAGCIDIDVQKNR